MKSNGLLSATILAMALSTAVLACGGDDDAEGPQDGDGDSSQPSAADGGVVEGSDSGGGDSGLLDGDSGERRAIVMVGDTTYEFDMSGNFADSLTSGEGFCIPGPIVQGTGNDADGGETRMQFEFMAPDQVNLDNRVVPRITLTDGTTGEEWRAAETAIFNNYPGLEAGGSQIDSWSIDGARVSGTATFFDATKSLATGDVTPVQGTFEIDCTGA